MICLTLFLSCSDRTPEIDYNEDGASNAYKTLSKIKDGNIKVRYIYEQYTAKGKFHHLRVVSGSGQASGNKFAIDGSGKLLDLGAASDALLTRHREDWGSLTFRTAQWLYLNSPPEIKVRRFSFYFDEQNSHDDVYNVLKNYGAEKIKVSDIIPIASFDLPVGNVVNLASLDITNNLSIISDEPVDFQVDPSGETSAHYTESVNDYNAS